MRMRLKIPNIDRVGLILDISKVLDSRGVNIASMEVEINTTYLETEPLLPEMQRIIIEDIRKIPQVLDVIPIEFLPHQVRTKQLEAIMASVGDGIIAIDLEACITHYDPAAGRIIKIPYHEVIGKPITDIFPNDTPLLEALR